MQQARSESSAIHAPPSTAGSMTAVAEAPDPDPDPDPAPAPGSAPALAPEAGAFLAQIMASGTSLGDFQNVSGSQSLLGARERPQLFTGPRGRVDLSEHSLASEAGSAIVRRMRSRLNGAKSDELQEGLIVHCLMTHIPEMVSSLERNLDSAFDCLTPKRADVYFEFAGLKLEERAEVDSLADSAINGEPDEAAESLKRLGKLCPVPWLTGCVSALRQLAGTHRAEIRFHLIDLNEEDPRFHCTLGVLTAHVPLVQLMSAEARDVYSDCSPAEVRRAALEATAIDIEAWGSNIRMRDANMRRQFNEIRAATPPDSIAVILTGSAHVAVSRGLPQELTYRVPMVLPEEAFQYVPEMFRDHYSPCLSTMKSVKRANRLPLTPEDKRDAFLYHVVSAVVANKYPELGAKLSGQPVEAGPTRLASELAFVATSLLLSAPEADRAQLFERCFACLEGSQSSCSSLAELAYAPVAGWLDAQIELGSSGSVPRFLRKLFHEIEVERAERPWYRRLMSSFLSWFSTPRGVRRYFRF